MLNANAIIANHVSSDSDLCEVGVPNAGVLWLTPEDAFDILASQPAGWSVPFDDDAPRPIEKLDPLGVEAGVEAPFVGVFVGSLHITSDALLNAAQVLYTMSAGRIPDAAMPLSDLIEALAVPRMPRMPRKGPHESFEDVWCESRDRSRRAVRREVWKFLIHDLASEAQLELGWYDD